jgi:hypothetical protein
MLRLSVLVCVLLFVCQAWCYRPVIMMHGIPVASLNVSGSYTDFNQMIEWIGEYHPGTLTLSINAFNGNDAFVPLWTQVDDISSTIYAFMEENKNAFTDGFHLVCHSQG